MAGILIVDDDPTIRAMFARALKPFGDVETAGNGAEALRLLGSKKYGVVLLDLHMPVIDGFVLLHTLSNKPGPNKDTPIYVVTADNSEQARVKAMRKHALFLLTKPVPIAMLTSLVDSTLKKAAARAAAAAAEGGEIDLDVDLPLVPDAGKPPSHPATGIPPSSPKDTAPEAKPRSAGGGAPARTIASPTPASPFGPKKPGT